jgi:hypothetical protein
MNLTCSKEDTALKCHFRKIKEIPPLSIPYLLCILSVSWKLFKVLAVQSIQVGIIFSQHEKVDQIFKISFHLYF